MGRHGVFTPEKTRRFEEELRFMARKAVDGSPPLTLPLVVTVTFYLDSTEVSETKTPLG